MFAQATPCVSIGVSAVNASLTNGLSSKVDFLEAGTRIWYENVVCILNSRGMTAMRLGVELQSRNGLYK